MSISVSNCSDQLQKIKALISSDKQEEKSFGYSTLLHFQQHSVDDPDSIKSLAECSHTLIHALVFNISEEDEEIATQALKCLGFMMYHPSIVAKLSVEDTSSILDTLSKLVTTTKLKSVCTLGVWCISIQQLDVLVLSRHFHSLLPAVVHALDNPMGSLSTTFEATQAVMKLVVQLSAQMRESAHLWAPSIYRRLLSTEKRERDVSERCLLKIRSTIVPPSVNLSKVLVKDIKLKLLSVMKDMLNDGMKIQVVRAWEWFVRMLGCQALKYRHLVNDMLKIPECTFTDPDPQIQKATQVAWESLIDALIQSPIPCSKEDKDQAFQNLQKSKRHDHEIGFLKSIKLIMTPLVGIMSSKCDVSVHSSCFDTWGYLLHKLHTFVNDPSVAKLVLVPVLEAVFQKGPNGKSMFLWDFCLNMLTQIISEKFKDVDSSTDVHQNLLDSVSFSGPSTSGTCSWNKYPIRWLPWDAHWVGFHLSMISILMNQASGSSVPHDSRKLVYDAALRLFRLVVKGIQMEFRSPPTEYDDVKFCLSTLLKFVKQACEGTNPNLGNLSYTGIQYIEAVTEELGSFMSFPLYKFALDLEYISVESVSNSKQAEFLGVRCINYMDMVSPMTYLLVLYFYLMLQGTSNTPEFKWSRKRRNKYFTFMFSSDDSLENLLISTGLLYKHIEPNCLNIWMDMVEGLKSCMEDVKYIQLLKTIPEATTYSVICLLLAYPLVVYSFPAILNSSSTSMLLQGYPVSPQRNLRLGHLSETWKSLYKSFAGLEFNSCTAVNFSEELCLTLGQCLDMLENINEISLTNEDMSLDFFSLLEDFMISVLEQISGGLNSGTERSRDGSAPNHINNCLKLSTRYIDILWAKSVRKKSGFVGTSRFFSALARFASCLYLKEDILFFLKVLSSSILQWLSNLEIQDKSTNDQIQYLLAEIFRSLQKNHPPLIFDSALLKLLEPLLERTLDHPHPSISEPTILFWNATFRDQIKLDYPENLLHVLNKLSRNGRIKLQKRNLPLLESCQSKPEVHRALQGYRVTAKHNGGFKRVELVVDTTESCVAPQLRSKRKRLELTEHQKEVRRAQQGRERDSGGHGPGIRTYTNVDFSQGIEDSQESQEIRDSEAIMEMLRKDG